MCLWWKKPDLQKIDDGDVAGQTKIESMPVEAPASPAGEHYEEVNNKYVQLLNLKSNTRLFIYEAGGQQLCLGVSLKGNRLKVCTTGLSGDEPIDYFLQLFFDKLKELMTEYELADAYGVWNKEANEPALAFYESITHTSTYGFDVVSVGDLGEANTIVKLRLKEEVL